jgi:hypothetical protein
MNKIKSESGVSELIGAILLVSLVVMMMMVVTTVLISQPRPEKIPELGVFISNGMNNVTLTHMGGDSLQAGEYLVVIDGNIIKFYYDSSGSEKQEWSFEKPIIVIYNQPTPKTVELYYNGPSNKVLLAKTDLT